jgi:hypothetical protein
MSSEFNIARNENSVFGLTAEYLLTSVSDSKVTTVEVSNGGELSSPMGGGTSIVIKGEDDSSHELIVRPPIADQEQLLKRIGEFAAFVVQSA